MSNIVPFNFNSNVIRTLTDEKGEPWFVAGDIADALGYRDSANMVRILDEDEAGTHNLSIRSENGVEQVREVTIINESGLYSAILKSRKEEAKVFKKWVTSEVLPSIRKTGSYSKLTGLPFIVSETKAAVDLANLFGIVGNDALISADRTVALLHKVSPMQLIGISHLTSLQQATHFTPTEIGKQMGVSAREVNIRLMEAGLQNSINGKWEMTYKGTEYGRLLDTGKKHGSGTPVTQLKWLLKVKDLI